MAKPKDTLPDDVYQANFVIKQFFETRNVINVEAINN